MCCISLGQFSLFACSVSVFPPPVFYCLSASPALVSSFPSSPVAYLDQELSRHCMDQNGGAQRQLLIRVLLLPAPKVLRNSVGGIILGVHLTTSTPPKFLHGGGSRVARICADPADTSASRSPPSVTPSSTALGDDGRRYAPPLRRLHDFPTIATLPAACGTGPTRLC